MNFMKSVGNEQMSSEEQPSCLLRSESLTSGSQPSLHPFQASHQECTVELGVCRVHCLGQSPRTPGGSALAV